MEVSLSKNRSVGLMVTNRKWRLYPQHVIRARPVELPDSAFQHRRWSKLSVIPPPPQSRSCSLYVHRAALNEDYRRWRRTTTTTIMWTRFSNALKARQDD